MIIFIFYILFFTSAEAKVIYTSMDDSTKTIELTNNKYKSALLIDEDCSNCTRLIKRLGKKCKSFESSNFVVFATGSIKNLKRKLKPVSKKDFNVYRNADIQTLLETGATALPSYISKKGKMFVGEQDSYKAIIKDKVCLR